MLPNKIEIFIQKQDLFQAPDRILLAISGGVDSVVLLYLLLELGYKPGLIHCNFQLRDEASDLDEAFIKNLAEEHQLPVFTQQFDTDRAAKEQGVSIQMMARDQRYAYFETIRTVHEYDYILTAHHLDDRIETFLLNFMRGTGFAGLRSIPTKNDFIRRPLLCVNRSAILDYQVKHEIAFREDESNASDKYKRNFVRHHVLTRLYEQAPQLAGIARHNFDRLDQMYLLYQAQVEQMKAEMVKKTALGFTIDMTAIRSHPAKESLLWEFLKDYGFSQEELRQFLESKPGTLLEVKGSKFLINKELLIVEKKEQDLDSLVWNEREDSIQLTSYKKLTKAIIDQPKQLKTPVSEILVNTNQLIYPLILRHWQAGDYFHPFGMNGRRQKLQDYFINNKINRLDRDKAWLLINGDGRIVWIVGHRMGDDFRVKGSSMQARVTKLCQELNCKT